MRGALYSKPVYPVEDYEEMMHEEKAPPNAMPGACFVIVMSAACVALTFAGIAFYLLLGGKF